MFDEAMVKLVAFDTEIQKMLKVIGKWKVPETKYVKSIINVINDLRVEASTAMSKIDHVLENPTNEKGFDFDFGCDGTGSH